MTDLEALQPDTDDSAPHLEQRLRETLVPLVSLMRKLDHASDISAAHMSILNLLRSKPLTIGQLAQVLSISQPAASQHVRALQQRQLVTATAHPDDLRAKILTVTPEGHATAQRANRMRNAQLRGALNKLTSEERHDIDAALPALARLATFELDTEP